MLIVFEVSEMGPLVVVVVVCDEAAALRNCGRFVIVILLYGFLVFGGRHPHNLLANS